MPLDFGHSTDSFTPFIRFKASSVTWEMGEEGLVDTFEFNSPAVFDFGRIQLGWLMLAPGAYDWVEWPDNNVKNCEQPQDERGEYKSAFSVNVYSPKLFGEEFPVRQFRSSAAGVQEFIKAAYAECEQKSEGK